MTANGLIKDKLFNEKTFEDHAKTFDFKEAAFLAADTLRMCVEMEDPKGILTHAGAIASLGIELEDLKFLEDPQMMERVVKALMV